MDTQKEMVILATIHVFNQKGMKFTMDDIAKELSMSKKTIYTIFSSKKELINAIIDYCFDSIKEAEKEILNNDQLTLMDKIEQILGVLPKGYEQIDLNNLYNLKEKYPSAYKKVEQRLESGWESTISLLEEGIAQGLLVPFSIPLFKMTFEAALEKFFKSNILNDNNIAYSDALKMVVQLLLNGIRKDT